MSAIIRRRIVIAILVSVFLHFGFLVWSYFCKILPTVPFPVKPEAVFHVRIAPQELMGQEKLKFESETSLKTPNPDNPFSENMAVKPSIESEELIKNNIESSIQKNKESLIPSSMQENQVLKKSEFNDIVMTHKVRRSPRESLVKIGEVPTENFASGSPVLVSGVDISRYFLDKSAVPANTSLEAPLQSANTQNEFQMMKRNSLGNDKESKSIDLGTALTYQLFKYQDPAGQKYFKLIVKVRDATLNFPVIPKEIIFLLDASGSIGAVRLSEEKQAIAYSLNHLNPHDRFNILVFNNKTQTFAPASVENTPKNIKDALDFLGSLKSWSTTDIYGALRSSIDLPNPFVPSYRVIMTDGIPTAGVQDDRKVINEISSINDDKVSFFTFGGGADVDPYMLDFIAFKNRGWSRVADREYYMGKELSKLYDEIKDPLLLNVRYYVSGLDDMEIFPRTMPDFFKGSQFVVYGKYTNEDKFAMQVIGDTTDGKKQFIVSASLQFAALGDKQIAHDWVFHKIYYLISILKYNQDNDALLRAIQNLCSKYHILTPYSINFNEPAPKFSRAPGHSLKPTQAAVVKK